MSLREAIQQRVFKTQIQTDDGPRLFEMERDEMLDTPLSEMIQ